LKRAVIGSSPGPAIRIPAILRPHCFQSVSRRRAGRGARFYALGVVGSPRGQEAALAVGPRVRVRLDPIARLTSNEQWDGAVKIPQLRGSLPRGRAPSLPHRASYEAWILEQLHHPRRYLFHWVHQEPAHHPGFDVGYRLLPQRRPALPRPERAKRNAEGVLGRRPAPGAVPHSSNQLPVS